MIGGFSSESLVLPYSYIPCTSVFQSIIHEVSRILQLGTMNLMHTHRDMDKQGQSAYTIKDQSKISIQAKLAIRSSAAIRFHS